MRPVRKGEYVCYCSAYKFPHRFTGGRCSGYDFSQEYWEAHYGAGDCTHCPCFNSREGYECEVVTGQERVSQCRAFQEFVHVNEVIIYKKRKRR